MGDRGRLALDPVQGRRVGVQQPVVGVEDDQRAEGGEIHLPLGHPAGGQLAQRFALGRDGHR